jgi:hypothetical protein
LLQNSYNTVDKLIVSSDIVQSWKAGHPNFVPFKLQQRVVLKINKIGNQLKYKLGQKYEGPYEVVKIQSNGVSYEIRDICSTAQKVFKVHHKQLKVRNDPPS